MTRPIWPLAALLAAVVGVSAAVLVRGTQWSTAGDAPASIAVVLAAPLVLAAAVLAVRPAGAALLLAGAWAWLMADWSNPDAPGALVFTTGLVASGFAGAFVAHALPASGRVATAAAYTSAVMLGPLIATTADPQAQGCGSCPTDLLRLVAAPGLARELERWGLVLGAAALALAVAGGLTGLALSSAARQRVAAPVVLPAAGFLAVVGVRYVHELERGFATVGPLDRALRITEAVLLLAMAAGLGWLRVDTLRMRSRLANVVVEMSDTTRRGGLGALLTDALDDPTLELLYVVDGRWVDAEGRSRVPDVGRERTLLLEEGEPVAAVMHRRGLLDDGRLVEALEHAARLGLDHERLHAQLRAEVARLRAARAAVVAAADDQRGRLERDLHDGAQQGLAALTMAIGLERTRAGDDTSACLQLAQARAQDALNRVRTIAHSLYPAALGDAGLAAALDVLSEWRPHVELLELPDERFSPATEAGAYFLVAALTRAPAPAVVSASSAHGRLVVEVRTGRVEELVEVEDRVGALGGQLTTEPITAGGTLVRAELPCAS